VVDRQDQLSIGISADLSGPETVDEAARFFERDFLLQLGAAMRSERTHREMSRRELARRSGVSERCIALIEAGKGNVSIVLLIRLLRVFGSDLPDAA
jgi:DNA-binding XRE family transcriptional regulator